MSIFQQNRDLLTRFRGGERAALAEVYEYFVDDVAVLARRGFTMESQGHVYVAGVDGESERDIVQDTFTKAFAERARISYDGLRPYRPFLLRITKNSMIDRYRAVRKQGAEESLGVGDIDEVLGGNLEFRVEPDRADDLHWKRLAETAAEFVASLDSETRDVVRLRFDQELSQDAAAARLGCSRRRIRTVEDRVQKRLARHLKQLGLVTT